MPQQRRRRKNEAAPLAHCLALNNFMFREFGCTGVPQLIGALREQRADFSAEAESPYMMALVPLLQQEKDSRFRTVTPEILSQYDANIGAHSRRLRMAGEHGRAWKPHQYIALLLTEHYLRRYFEDAEKLLADLNFAKYDSRLMDRRGRVEAVDIQRLPDYTPRELRTVAFQSATGSGKTLLMHAHILQYRHYLQRAGGRLNNIILLTPNEQMSAQHRRELSESGMHARLFSHSAAAEIFSTVEILDLNKLAERKGVKRVAVGDFGDDNLVLVDEGHLGASGKVWRTRRAELARGGFTFEYSATFNQVTQKESSGELRAFYGKSLLFDYPYRQFYEEGYGKEYAIMNLPGGAQDENSTMYLLGCLLTFYQQCKIWRRRAAEWHQFNPAKPLWVFLGKTVTGGGKADQATKADVVQILEFIAYVLAQGADVRAKFTRLLAGQSGLNDGEGDFFAGRFRHLQGQKAEALYAELCTELFHGPGRLHVDYLTKGEGELLLRSGNQGPFGVVNVGDSAALYKQLEARANADITLKREKGFATGLFHEVDRPDSPVNVVIGARRFIAGWNSWRVSTMGLMHVGVGEGPEIIQMFGRGVRLKGRGFSLKRHRANYDDFSLARGESEQLEEMQKLYIFGLRANYMETFREMLAQEGITRQLQKARLPVVWNFARETDLKLIRLPEGLDFADSEARPVLPPPGANNSPETIKLDLYSQLQRMESNKGGANASPAPEKQSASLAPFAPLFNRTRIYHNLLARKQREGWRCLHIATETVDALLQNHDWYELHIPPERLQLNSFRQVRKLERIFARLAGDYADAFWRRERRRWENQRYQVVKLNNRDPNRIREYTLLAERKLENFAEDVRTINARLKDEDLSLPHHYPITWLNFGALFTDRHAYKPLLYTQANSKVKVQPVALNEGEKDIVDKLVQITKRQQACLQGRELFLIRNLTRGRGVSFFDDHAYFPDFIVWLKRGEEQHVLFLDPKGLHHFGPKERRKVALHAEIRNIEKRLQPRDPNLHLHAYVLSATRREDIGDKLRSNEEWARRGVYFLHDRDCMRKVIADALH